MLHFPALPQQTHRLHHPCAHWHIPNRRLWSETLAGLRRSWANSCFEPDSFGWCMWPRSHPTDVMFKMHKISQLHSCCVAPACIAGCPLQMGCCGETTFKYGCAMAPLVRLRNTNAPHMSYKRAWLHRTPCKASVWKSYGTTCTRCQMAASHTMQHLFGNHTEITRQHNLEHAPACMAQGGSLTCALRRNGFQRPILLEP